ncbi:hypothetical protein ACODT5_02125 [Streptomyces sp. 5.8]|uniref:hypothetical protein n=1 Tax=Streptomyces sp. 5.8 TaxID=3406571 RepID=UPI003BB50AB1
MSLRIRNQFLDGPRVVNHTLQDHCPFAFTGHLGMPFGGPSATRSTRPRCPTPATRSMPGRQTETAKPVPGHPDLLEIEMPIPQTKPTSVQVIQPDKWTVTAS